MSKDGNGDIKNFHNAITTSGNSTIRKVFAKQREEYIPAGSFFHSVFNIHNTLMWEIAIKLTLSFFSDYNESQPWQTTFTLFLGL